MYNKHLTLLVGTSSLDEGSISRIIKKHQSGSSTRVTNRDNFIPPALQQAGIKRISSKELLEHKKNGGTITILAAKKTSLDFVEELGFKRRKSFQRNLRPQQFKTIAPPKERRWQKA